MSHLGRRAGAALACALLALAGLAARADDGEKVRAAPDQDQLRARAFSPERTHARRRALAEKLGKGSVAVLYSGKSNGSDARGHFAERNFLYLTGIAEPGVWMLVDAERELLILAPRDPARETWIGARLGPGEETAKRFGVDAARSTEDLVTILKEAFKDAASIRVSGTDEKELAKMGVLPAGAHVESAAPAIARLRQVKDEDELALLRRACVLSASAFKHAAKAIAADRFEFEAQALFECACRFHGAEAQGYPSIVGSGPNSCVLHYDANRRRMKAGDMLVFDAGCECGGYSADVTRTFPVSGTFTDEQRRVYEAVLRAQDAGIAACKPGTTIKQVHDAARAVLVQEKLEKFLPHGVSHWLGLDVHDAGDYTAKLEPGCVLTVEPGCYMPEKELGVRIEDDILVTEQGPVNLSAGAPRAAAEVEALLARARAGSIDVPPLPKEEPLPPLRKRKLY